MTKLTEKNQTKIKRKGLIGIIYFLGNSSYTAVLGLAANLIFTIFLTPAEYGLYFIVLSLIAILNYFTDLGLAAALIQRKDPQEEEFYTAFTIQFALVSIIVVLGAVATPLIARLYNFDHTGVALYAAMLFSLFLLSFKSVPSTRLERQLDYGKIVLTQAVENTFFYGVSIVLMLTGFRIYALVAAIVVRSILGVTLIYYFTRWRPRLFFSAKLAKGILSFGIPFQSNVFLAFIKDDLLNLYLANRLGLSGIGYVGWAKKWAEAPLRIIMDNVNRVLFPVFSQFQDNPEKIKKGIEKLLFYNALVLLPTLLGAYLVMPYFVEVIPKYHKWVGAVPSFNFFLISSFLVSLASPLINIFNSLGRVRTSVKFMLLWIVLNWTVVPLMITAFGYTGVSIAFALNALSFVVVWWRLRQLVPVNYANSLKKPILASLIMLVSVKLSQLVVQGNFVNLLLSTTIGILTYGIAILFLTHGSFLREIRELLLPKINH
jgi:O-antigen/teichoic acid export membrane protein